MEKDTEKRIAELEKALKALPEKTRSVFYWIMENFDSVEKICRNSDLTDEEIRQCEAYAKAKDNDLLLALICLSKLYRDGKYTSQ